MIGCSGWRGGQVGDDEDHSLLGLGSALWQVGAIAATA